MLNLGRSLFVFGILRGCGLFFPNPFHHVALITNSPAIEMNEKAWMRGRWAG
jgi:hypothetical protein